MMDTKKISFGFLKTKKAEKPIVEDKKEFIECVEEKSIKVIGGETIEETVPLVIPMKPNTLITAERIKQIAYEVEKGIEEPDPAPVDTLNKDNKAKNETLDQMAVRELLEDSNKERSADTSVLKLPLRTPETLVLDGQIESTLEDYESVPIQDFGMAMLRGMGWSEGAGQTKYKQPQLRPKGLGLGADKVVKETQKKNASKVAKDEELSIIKNAFVKIIVGKHSSYYGKVVSLDEDNGRVLVDIPVKKETVSLSELMVQPVSKSEFDKQSRVINADKYNEYKNQESLSSKRLQIPQTSKHEASTSEKSKENKTEKNKSQREMDKSSNGKKERLRRDSSSTEERSISRRKKDKKRYSSHESLSSSSDDRKKHKDRRRIEASDSDSSEDTKKHKKIRNRSKSPSKKRDIDKKRKGKKKRRDRDRSPNYRKHKSKN